MEIRRSKHDQRSLGDNFLLKMPIVDSYGPFVVPQKNIKLALHMKFHT